GGIGGDGGGGDGGTGGGDGSGIDGDAVSGIGGDDDGAPASMPRGERLLERSDVLAFLTRAAAIEERVWDECVASVTSTTGLTSCGSATPSKSRVMSASVMPNGMPPTAQNFFSSARGRSVEA
ncbi:MAG: hypothetical protein VX113_09305, partial [Pseudomonadota bacterium]|nr:hypothetical protein [Pseudomonadota bacterium]